ncbi:MULTISPECIES: rod shape-determining protein MreC [Methylobacillus]|uniref:Cell shape-determining protein MreC n=1 Tax=Methylobacillus flagellatus (strain ATCC 51484 / DSM 6875 / VKM B-1610 / KT) TaxID=265072 RepID=Q1GYD0_METFK|nr:MULTISPECIES: rod shape-determining protein MreC [Methylobacillus]ABE50757.1 rod shape-determining protein MreC [Methylobacillus flagellatus KT]MPS47640.1 rod shape-determining protein MreC [Methylobacillus sp.]
MPRALEHQHHTGFFVRGPSPIARLLFFSVLSLALIVTDARLNYLIEVRQGFIALLHPLQIIANAPLSLVEDVGAYLHTQTTLAEENTRLRHQALMHAEELQRFQALMAENERLRSLLGAAQVSSQPARLAEILHMGRDPFSHKVVVNLGSRQNIVPGQAAIDEHGVIGQVTRVYPFSSEVTLITDKELSIPVQIERNGLRAIAFGQGRNATLELPSLPANVDIQVGDKLVTSGIDGIYPPGLAVAEIIRVEADGDSPFAHIIGKPIAGIDRHRQLLLVSIPQVERPADSSAVKTNSATQKTTPTKRHVRN